MYSPAHIHRLGAFVFFYCCLPSPSRLLRLKKASAAAKSKRAIYTPHQDWVEASSSRRPWGAKAGAGAVALCVAAAPGSGIGNFLLFFSSKWIPSYVVYHAGMYLPGRGTGCFCFSPPKTRCLVFLCLPSGVLRFLPLNSLAVTGVVDGNREMLFRPSSRPGLDFLTFLHFLFILS